MNKVAASPQTSAVKEKEAPPLDPEIAKRYKMRKAVCELVPIAPEYMRKIHHLWDNHFRVNLHDHNDQNKIKTSYHIVVKPIPGPVEGFIAEIWKDKEGQVTLALEFK